MDKLFGKIQNTTPTKVVSKKTVEVCEDNCVCKKAKTAKVKPVKEKQVKAKPAKVKLVKAKIKKK